MVTRFETTAVPASAGPGAAADAASPTRFRFALLDPDGAEVAAVWTAAGEAFAYDAASGTYAALGAAGPAAVRRLLPAAFDALVVPALLAGDGAALDFEAASLDGAEPCGDGGGRVGSGAAGADRCFAVSAIRMSGALEYRLWFDAESRLVRRVELVVYPAEEILGRAAAEAGLSGGGAAAGGGGRATGGADSAAGAATSPRTFRVTHEILTAGSAPGGGPGRDAGSLTR